MTVIGTKQHMVTFCYPKVFVPEANDMYKGKRFSVQILIPKKYTDVVKAVQTAIEEAKAYGFSKGIFDKKTTENPAFKLCLKDGDKAVEEDTEGKKAYLAGHYYLNCWTGEDSPPAVLDSRLQDIMDRNEIYSGCKGAVNLNFRPYNKGSNGIASYLAAIMKLADGEPIGGAVPNKVAFAGLADLEDAVDTSEDLM